MDGLFIDVECVDFMFQEDGGCSWVARRGQEKGGDGGRLVSHIFSALFLPSLSAFVLVVAVVERGGPVRWTTVVCV